MLPTESMLIGRAVSHMRKRRSNGRKAATDRHMMGHFGLAMVSAWVYEVLVRETCRE